MSARIVFRPLEAWTDPRTPVIGHQFSASWTATLNLLGSEVEALQPGRHTSVDVILQVQAAESAMRKDGSIKADAKVRDDGVVVSFESKHGSLRYACDRFTGQSWGRGLAGWQANVRAIALTLTDLRRIERYGVGARGEQYTGWAELGSGGATTVDAAKALLCEYGNVPARPTDSDWKELHRRALMATHPDRGGDREAFDRVQAAYAVISGG